MALARLMTMIAVLATSAVVLGVLAGLHADNGPPPKLLFGLGDEISAATSSPLYLHGGVNMVTSWYNGPSDLDWMSGYAAGDTISGLYRQGKALELIVWLADEPEYAVSPQFQADIQRLVQIFKGNGPYYGPLYIVLFTEFETYSDQPGYDIQLRSAYLEAVREIHSIYQRAYVALGFGGYVWTTASPVRDLQFWKPAIAASDFTAFQAMQDETSRTPSGENIVVPEIEDAVRQLGRFGKPVMVSHFELWGDPKAASKVLARVAATVLSGHELKTLSSQGLFAFDFMGAQYVNGDGPGFIAAESVLTRYAAGPAHPTYSGPRHAGA